MDRPIGVQPHRMMAAERMRDEECKSERISQDHFFHWPGLGSIGPGPDGTIVVGDEEGVYILASECSDSLSADIIQEVIRTLPSDAMEKRHHDTFWAKQLRVADINAQGLPIELMTMIPKRPPEPRVEGLRIEVNGMHKRKAQKIHPIDESGQKTREIEGRLDWKQRAQARQTPNTDSESVPFAEYFEPRYARFPRGMRMTPQRLSEMKISNELQSREREMLTELLYRREGALAWDFSESGRVSEEVVPPVTIDTVPHKAWQADQFPIPRKLREVVIDMVQERINRGTLELCKSQYRNPWFLVAKKDKGYRLINNAQKINGVTVRDANPPPNPDEFAEEFAGCAIMSLLDFFSGYDQVALHKDSRDITAFYTPLGLVRQCTLPMGTTNSVAEFVRVMTKICKDHIPHRCMPYLDDVCVKGPKTNYNLEELEPGIRKYVFEHLSNVDKVLADIERAGATVSGHKSDLCYGSMIVVGYRVDANGRHPDQKKVSKIRTWPACKDVKEIRMFLGICVYYRVWIQGFAVLAEPLFRLMRKNAPFEWSSAQEEAMEALKDSLCSAPALVSITYNDPRQLIIVAVDGSKKGWGAVLMQLDLKGHRHPIRYESGVWSKSERNWDSGKHECKALLLTLKKFRSYLYGVRFTVETDAKTLVAQLQRSATDLPGALVTRWLALLNLWDFDIVHVAGKKNVVADALSRRPEGDDWEPPDEPEEDVEEFIDAQLSAARLFIGNAAGASLALLYGVGMADLSFSDNPLEGKYSSESQEIARWILFRKRPEHLSKAEFRKFKTKALRLTIRDHHLFTLPTGGRPLRRVVDDPEEQHSIIRAMHDDSGHRGKEGTWRKVWSRYHWKGQYEQVKAYVLSCAQCQAHATRIEQEVLWPSEPPAILFGWISIDVVYMPPGKNGKKFLVVARCHTSQWPEAEGLSKNDSKSILRFLERKVFCRWGMPLKISVDGGPENRGVLIDLQNQWGINRVVASAYNPKAQGMIERGHAAIVAALKKLPGDWHDNLHRVLWADRVTVKRSTGETPAYMVCGREHILPIELSIPTWQVLPWDEVTDTASLLAMRARQFEKRDVRLKESIARTVRLRQENKDYFDDSKIIRPEKLKPGDLVLLKDSFHENDRSILSKFLPKWQGPFRIQTANEKGYYTLCELDGTPFRSNTPGNRLKKFMQRTPFELEQIDRLLGPEEQVESTDEPSDDDLATLHDQYGQDIPPNTRSRTRAAQELQIARDHDAEEAADLARSSGRKLLRVQPRPNPTFDRAEYEMVQEISKLELIDWGHALSSSAEYVKDLRAIRKRMYLSARRNRRKMEEAE
jgi:hypothetical protein